MSAEPLSHLRRLEAEAIFFDRDGRHHVDPQILSAVRAQRLETCSCGAHYEVGMNCYLCANRQDWIEVELHYNE